MIDNVDDYVEDKDEFSDQEDTSDDDPDSCWSCGVTLEYTPMVTEPVICRACGAINEAEDEDEFF